MDNNTPRLRPGRFPNTPPTDFRGQGRSRTARPGSGSPPRPPRSSPTSPNASFDSSADEPMPAKRSAPLPMAPVNTLSTQTSPPPVIPLTLLDAPTQRLYAASAYIILIAWRLVDWMRLGEDLDSSWMLFLKWVFIDFMFLFGLPELRIPWLELSQTLVLSVFATHALFTYMLMFNIGIPLFGLFGLFQKLFWDREMALSEHRVKLSTILNNESLIMGKQIINILPEGSATLNPDARPFCLDKKNTFAMLPIQFNSTIPKDIELMRIDLDSGAQEIIRLKSGDIKKIAKHIKDETADPEASPPAVMWEYKIKKAGVYRLHRVLDEFKLEVQRRARDTNVVPCPQAAVKSTPSADRCVRDLSDLSLEVFGTPPLRIHYSRTINGKDHSFHFQSLQPESFESPLVPSLGKYGLLDEGDGDVSWVKPAKVSVPLNESMTAPGEWKYTIAEVHDALGNKVNYTASEDELDVVLPPSLEQRFRVKERPRVHLEGCNSRQHLKVARGRSTKLPLNIDVGLDARDTAYSVSWDYSPAHALSPTGDHGDVVERGSYNGKDTRFWPDIMAPGLYTIRTISSNGCDGEIQEPSSCLLYNPPEPELGIHAEEIPDKCAGNSIGLNVDLHLVGTPPFQVRYDVLMGNSPPRRERLEIRGLRHQLQLLPKAAGHHKYIFKQIDDAIYKGVTLMGSEMVLEQDVKPAARAVFQSAAPVIPACLEDAVEIEVALIGDGPFALEWEIFHDGKRKTQKVTDLNPADTIFKIKTEPLVRGGDYIVSLNSIQDRAGCRYYLDEEVKIAVRRQKPRAAFGEVEGRRSITGIEGNEFRMPLRLQGEDQWTVTYRNVDNPHVLLKHRSRSGNDALVTTHRGTWEMVAVEDDMCPGVVDAKAATFETAWFPKPQISLVESDGIIRAGLAFIKPEICEGDIDGFDIALTGNPPYSVLYHVNHKPHHGHPSVRQSELDAPLSKVSVPVDSLKPGDYTYVFAEPSDNLYTGTKGTTALSVKQRVNAKPSASFAKPGQSFKYCQLEQTNEDKIAISLNGVPPFAVEFEIKHQSGGNSPTTLQIDSIPTKSHNVQIPRRYLSLGTQQVRIRAVRDSRGCRRAYEGVGGPSVQVNLYEAPALFPLESRKDYCVGERIAYTLSGSPPFDVLYEFDGQRRARVGTTDFRRVAESPGVFTIHQVSDSASECRAPVAISRTIHPLPGVRMSRGQHSRVDIHEGGTVDILFEFSGTPPFDFTYTRSTNARKGQRSTVLETRHETSFEHAMTIPSSQEGTYEVVSIKDKYCAFSVHSGPDRDKKM